MTDRKVTVIQIDNRPRCESEGDYLGQPVPCDDHQGHAGRHPLGSAHDVRGVRVDRPEPTRQGNDMGAK